MGGEGGGGRTGIVRKTRTHTLEVVGINYTGEAAHHIVRLALLVGLH